MKQHTIERTIMWGDLDALGIVFYPRFYEWIDAAGHLFFDSVGLNLVTLMETRSIIFGLAETGCSYTKPARYMQRIHITTEIDALHSKIVTLKHRIFSTNENSLLVEGFEKRICMDVSNPKQLTAIRIPADIYDVLNG